MPRLNSSLGSSALPARIVSFSFWLCWASSRNFIDAALDPEETEGIGSPLGVEDGIAVAGCCADGVAVDGGCVAGVVDDAGNADEEEVAGAFPWFRNDEKELIVNPPPDGRFGRGLENEWVDQSSGWMLTFSRTV